MKSSYIDLHVHSNASDGTLSPAEVVALAAKLGLGAIALTDHDTMDGSGEAEREAQIRNIELLKGIELSTDYNGTEVHILGFGINDNNPTFSQSLLDFRSERDKRNQKMAKKLQETGFSITLEELHAAFPDAVLTRAHFARYLLDTGQVRDRDTVFRKYIGNGCNCYVPREKITPYEAIDMIHSGGGLAFFAHPILCRMNIDRLDFLIRTMTEHGLDGLEAIYSTYMPGEERQIRHFAQKYGLLISGGSDFHGSNKPSIQLGTGKGNLHVPYEILTAIKEKLTPV